MDIVYTLIVMFTSVEGGLTATTTIKIEGYPHLMECVQALDNANIVIGDDPEVIDYTSACVQSTSA